MKHLIIALCTLPEEKQNLQRVTQPQFCPQFSSALGIHQRMFQLLVFIITLKCFYCAVRSEALCKERPLYVSLSTCALSYRKAPTASNLEHLEAVVLYKQLELQ